MRTLTVENFSCIENATLNLSPYTVIIGPQASGKSVLSKLIYFFNRMIAEQIDFALDGNSIDEYKEFIVEQFHLWFPVTAWGTNQFSITYKTDNFSIKLRRTKYKVVSDNIKITLSDEWVNFYQNSLATAEESTSTKNPADRDEFEFMHSDFRVRSKLRRALESELPHSYVSGQIFIPAGRAFFTSLGKAVTAFEGARLLDPVTTAFGKIFASYKDGLAIRPPKGKKDYARDALFTLLGGIPQTNGDREFVELQDGRVVPYSALSSGQQELLPLVLMLSWMFEQRPKSVSTRLTSAHTGRMTYIEEPEAHLFPISQSKIVETLVTLANRSDRPESLLLTTHSPYILAKLNNLIKAGKLAKDLSQEKLNQLMHITPKFSWIAPSTLNAYAIIDGNVKNIIDEDGLIAADYLDDVSGHIASEFDALLNLEFSE